MPRFPKSLLLVVFAFCGAAQAETCAALKPDAVSALFDEWNLALASLKPDAVAERYWPDAVLVPASSNAPRTTPALIREYYAELLKRRPRGRVDARHVQLGCNMAVDAGAYTFSLMDAHGKTSETSARYTFVYAYRKGACKILHHHASLTPLAAEKDAEKDAKSGALAQRPASDAHGSTVAGGSRPFLNIDASPSIASFYPVAARDRGERGAVAMQICAGPSGELQRDPEILQSSGSERLDAAAQAWAYAARWIPATRDNKAVDGCTKVNVVFDA